MDGVCAAMRARQEVACHHDQAPPRLRNDAPARPRLPGGVGCSWGAGSGGCTPRGGPAPASPARTAACLSLPIAWPGGLPCPCAVNCACLPGGPDRHRRVADRRGTLKIQLANRQLVEEAKALLVGNAGRQRRGGKDAAKAGLGGWVERPAASPNVRCPLRPAVVGCLPLGCGPSTDRGSASVRPDGCGRPR